MSRGGSKTGTAIIAFLIGFIFAIIVEAAAIFGVCYYVANTDIDKLLGFVKVENKDENGDYIYINTDKNNGGVQNLKELFGVLYGYIFSEGATSPDYPVAGKTFAEIEKLLPVTSGIVDQLSSVVDPYIDVDWEEFRQTPFTDIVMFFNDCIMDTRPSKVLSALGSNDLVGDDANVIVKSLFTGAETEYAVTSSGLKLPVFYDTYTYDAGHDNYYRTGIVEQDEVYPAEQLSTDYLVETSQKDADGNVLYRLYYVPCSLEGGRVGEPVISEDFEGNQLNEEGKRVYETIYADGTAYIAVSRNAEGQFTLDENAVVADRTSYEYPSKYGDNYTNLTGNFYKNAAGEEVQINTVTINSLILDTFEPLYYVDASELLGNNSVTNEVFGDTSVGALIDNDIDLKDEIQSLALGSVIDNVAVTNDVMMYIVYKVTDVAQTEGGGYVGIYDKDGENIAVNIQVNEQNQVEKIVSAADGKEIKGATVSEISEIADNLSVTVLIDVKPDDAIMSYIGYGITNAREESGEIGGKSYDYVGKYKLGDGSSVVCYMATGSDGKVASAWYMDGANAVKIESTTVNTLSDRVSGLTENLTLGGVVDIKADNAIMAYMGYGITNIVAQQGDGYSYTGKYGMETCYIKTQTQEDGSEKIVSVWYQDLEGNRIYLDGTTIDGISDRIDGIKSDLTIGEIMGDSLTEDNKILWALRTSTINSLGDDVGQLTLSQVIDIDENSSNVLKQLKNTKIDDLSTAIDEITIQSIYAEEIYNSDFSYKAAQEYDPDAKVKYYVLKDGKYTAAGAKSDGYITQEEWNASVNGGSADPDAVTYYVFSIQQAESYNEAYLYYVSDGNGGYSLANGTGRLTAEEIAQFDENTYYTYGEAKGMWKLILYVDGENGVKVENVYTINNFHTMITQAAKNVNDATLYELLDAGVLTVNREDLGKTLVWGEGEGESAELGNLTLRELVNVVISMAK